MDVVSYIAWPCGCVSVYSDGPPARALWHVAYECPWCDAVISRADFMLWLSEAELLPPPITQQRALLRVGEKVVEANGECDGRGAPFVRERTHGARWRHLAVPMTTVEVLRN